MKGRLISSPSSFTLPKEYGAPPPQYASRASLTEAESEWTRRERGGTVFILRKKDAGSRGAPTGRPG